MAAKKLNVQKPQTVNPYVIKTDDIFQLIWQQQW